jgi:hypothetical protein
MGRARERKGDLGEVEREIRLQFIEREERKREGRRGEGVTAAMKLLYAMVNGCGASGGAVGIGSGAVARSGSWRGAERVLWGVGASWSWVGRWEAHTAGVGPWRHAGKGRVTGR